MVYNGAIIAAVYYNADRVSTPPATEEEVPPRQTGEQSGLQRCTDC